MALLKIEVTDLKTADECLAEIAKTSRKVKEIETKRNEKIDKEKLAVREDILELNEHLEQLELALGDFGYANKGMFEKPRSIKLTFGAIGFKKIPVVKPLSKWTWKKVLIQILKKKLKSGFSIKHTVNKKILSTWPDEKLKEIGARKTSEDKFSYSIRDEGAIE